jgi:UDPglucose 6-dehydrogenase
MVMVAVPTNFSEAIGAFDASVVEGVLAQVAAECPNAVTVIRSTMQPGVTSAFAAAKRLSRVLYCPEFLREGRSLDDCHHPDRLVIGADDPSIAEEYRTTVEDVYASNGVPMPPVVLCSTQEAEAAKLAANTYLALRVAFFNELDSFACHRGLDAGKVFSRDLYGRD